MIRINDLVKVRKPTMESLLAEAIKDTVELDKKKSNEDLELVKHENDTFYYRAIYLFLQRVQAHYTSEEVETWLKRELLKSDILPEIND